MHKDREIEWRGNGKRKAKNNDQTLKGKTYVARSTATKSAVTSSESRNMMTLTSRNMATAVAMPPAPNIRMILIFFLSGNCSDQVSGIGTSRITKSARTARARSEMKTLRRLRQCEFGRIGSQYALIGTQIVILIV